MIGFIRGKVMATFKTGRNVSSLVVWPAENEVTTAFGVAYTVLVTDRQAAQYVSGVAASWWLYQVHTENDNYFIGLESTDALTMFLHLLEVSGVGPRSAMQLLDILGVNGIETAIQTQDIATLSKVPGIGKKSAAKIVLELAGKLVELEKIATKTTSNGEFRDIIATLVKLGYSNNNAKDAVDSVREKLNEMKDADLSEKVKFVLAQR